MRYIIRYIAGFTLGLTLFVFLIPFGLYKLSGMDHLVFQAGISDSLILRIILSLPFFVTGVVFAVWSNIFLVHIGKGGPAEGFNIAVSPRTKKLVTSGPYRYSRNPMVFGAISLYISVSIFLNSFLCLITILVCLFPMVMYLREFEERRLLKDFGSEYIDYRNKVSMIFPVKRLKH